MLMRSLLLVGAERRPDKVAFHRVGRQRCLTYAEAVDQMDRMVGALFPLGVGRGDLV